MENISYLLNVDGEVDVDLCQAIADETAYQAWKDLHIDNPELYVKLTSNRAAENETDRFSKLK